MTDEQLNNIIVLIGAMIQQSKFEPENGKPPCSKYLEALAVASDARKALRGSVDA